MASVWDYDIVLMAISHLTDAMNRYREGRGEKPSRIFLPHVSEILKFCRRSDGGRQYEEIEGGVEAPWHHVRGGGDDDAGQGQAGFAHGQGGRTD